MALPALPLVLSGLLFPVLGVLPLAAEEDASGKLSIELNSVDTREAGCRMSFLVLNGHEADLKAAVFEAVLFDERGGVDRLILFDMGTLPSGRPRVRQFVVPELACDKLGRVLFNGAQTCEAEAAESDLCVDGLELRSRVDVEVIG